MDDDAGSLGTPGQFKPDWEFAMAMAHESDRGIVLISATLLDERLKDLLVAFLRPDERGRKVTKRLLSGPTGPLKDYWARLNMAYVLGLLPDPIYEALDALRRARNLMAHASQPLDIRTVAARAGIELPQVPAEALERMKGGPARVRKVAFSLWVSSLKVWLGSLRVIVEHARRLAVPASRWTQSRSSRRGWWWRTAFSPCRASCSHPSRLHGRSWSSRRWTTSSGSSAASSSRTAL